MAATPLAEIPAEALPPLPHGDPGWALQGFRAAHVPRRAVSWFYLVALSLVAGAMIILPLLYLAIVATAGWCLLWYAQNGLGLFENRSPHLLIVLYGGPLFAGAALLFFMVKPLFSAAAKTAKPLQLTREQEPAVWALVEHICQVVGSPVPRSIVVDCQVNASASFEHGVWSWVRRNLRLTIGLPLATGLTLEQLAGVLAHEFGHFGQSGGMRLSYVIRSISFWFARVVHERDRWDQSLAELSNSAGWLVVIGWMARGCVWLGRRVLWGLMWIGFAISSYLLRQMEFDADGSETAVVGSETFRTTSRRMAQLGIGAEHAWALVHQAFEKGHLPVDIPALIASRTEKLPADILDKLAAADRPKKSGAFDTHPTMHARVAASMRAAEKGIFSAAFPATVLFRDLAGLCRRATEHHYATFAPSRPGGVQIVENNLLEAHDNLRIRQLTTFAERFGGIFAPIVPLALPAEPIKDAATETILRTELASLPATVAETKAHFEQWSAAQQRADLQAAAAGLLAAGFRTEARALQDVAALENGETAYAETDRRRQEATHIAEGLQPFGTRMSTLLNAAVAVRLASTSDEAAQASAMAYWRALRTLTEHRELFYKVREVLITLSHLLPALNGRNDVQHALHVAGSIAAEGRSALTKTIPQLAFVPCPFPEIAEGTSMKDYLLLPPAVGAHPVLDHFRTAGRFVERFDESLQRIVGWLLTGDDTT